MSSSADRNLLFGILALQLDFINRDQLIEAMNAWVLTKERPLADILLERGALSAEDRGLLTPMVQRHIDRHGGDAARSLASLSGATPLRQTLDGIPDPVLQASVAHIPVTTQPKDDFPQTIDHHPAEESGTRYLIERPFAQGGLGEVFVARDRELNRKVALKHIRDRHADDPTSRSLFLREGEITGRLEHPGIVPVYGLGQYADGRPFYAMRFVQGDSLLAAIERFHHPREPLSATARNLAFRELLSRFLDVCNAIAYAHRRGVLHRDLKPGNVMLGEFGETLVIDWGLAKVLGAKDEASQERERLELTSTARTLVPVNEALATVGHGVHGTPGYMSPEQAAGWIDQLGPATDVYSLGAILFHLLAGRPPLTQADGDVLGRTVSGKLPTVRQFQPGVSRALEAICLKALALEPTGRHASVEALAVDVRCWLADEPVSAWREPWGVRARRWLRKHPRTVTGAVAALLVGLVAALGGSALLDAKNEELGTANVRLDGANGDLRATNVRLDEANTSLQAALSREETARRRADERTRLADERFTLALRTYREQVFDANSLLENRPGTQELRKAMMSRAVAGLQKLIKEAEQTRGAEHVRAWAHFALGDVYLKIDGQVEKARREYQIAFELSKRLAEADPKDAQAQRDLSISCNKIGDVLLQQGEVVKALEQYQEGLKIRKRLAEADPRNFEAQTDLIISHYKLGRTLMQAVRPQEAVAAFDNARTVLNPWQLAGKLKGTRFASWPGILDGELLAAQTAVKALGDLDALLKAPANELPELLTLRAELLARQDKHADAVSAADRVAKLAQSGPDLHRAAAAYAWCSRDKPQQDRHAARVLELLGKARDAGFFKDAKSIATLKTAEAFRLLLDRSDFKKLLADLDKK